MRVLDQDLVDQQRIADQTQARAEEADATDTAVLAITALGEAQQLAPQAQVPQRAQTGGPRRPLPRRSRAVATLDAYRRRIATDGSGRTLEQDRRHD